MAMLAKGLEFNNANLAQGNIVFGGPQMNAPEINQVNGQFGLGLDLAIKAAPGALYPEAGVVIGAIHKGVVNLAGAGDGAINIDVGAHVLALNGAINIDVGANIGAAVNGAGAIGHGKIAVIDIGNGAINIDVGANIGAAVNGVYGGLGAIDLAGVVAIHAPDPAPELEPLPALGDGHFQAPPAA